MPPVELFPHLSPALFSELDKMEVKEMQSSASWICNTFELTFSSLGNSTGSRRRRNCDSHVEKHKEAVDGRFDWN